MSTDKFHDPSLFYIWTVQFHVAAPVVADGFHLTNARARDMLCKHLPYTNGRFLHAQVVLAPRQVEIARERGYNTNETAELGPDIDYSKQRAQFAELAEGVVEEFSIYIAGKLTKDHLRRLVLDALHVATDVPKE